MLSQPLLSQPLLSQLLLSQPRLRPVWLSPSLLPLALCLWTLCFLTFCLGSVARAATLNVPAQYPTIQAAVNAAQPGDTVMVADGTYSGDGNRDITISNTSITVTSQHGPSKTIIDCGGYYSGQYDYSGNHRGFYIQTYSGGVNATVSGFTIKNGYEEAYYEPGGGIYAETEDTSAINITNCILTANTAYDAGGGIASDVSASGTVNITNCTVNGNATTGGNGGGIENSNSGSGTINITNSTVNSNTSANGAGGIENSNFGSGTINITNSTVNSNTAQYTGGIKNENANGSGTINVTNCTVSNNTVTGNSAGGISNFNYESTAGKVRVTGCTITGNTALFGGGIFNSTFNYYTSGSGQIEITNCAISGNTASGGAGYGGGGIYNSFDSYSIGTLTVTNCAITGNTAYDGGGILNASYGAYVTNSIVNCTILNNIAQDTTNGSNGSGGGLYNESNQTLTVTNTILYGDNTGGEVGYDVSNNDILPIITYSDVQGGYTGTGNINASPQFASSSNLHLLHGSPCLGAGNHSVAPATAKDGRARPNPPSIGAYEILPPSITSLSPTSAYAGGGSLTLTVNGSGFLSGAVVKFGSTSLATTFVSGTQLTATITSTLRATVGAYTIKVYNPGSVASSGATFTVKPRLTALTLSASRVSGGQTVTGTVTLNGPAPTGGVAIPLTSSSTTRATVPASVTVAAGATSATFPITTLAVTATGTTTLTANGAGGTLTATLTVLAPLTPSADTFGQDGSTANTNYGTTNPLLIKTATSPGTNRDSYLKFSVSGVSSITSAKLVVTAYLSGSGSLTTGVFGTASSWMESGLTWNNKPALGSSLGSFTATTTTNTTYTVDVTAYVQSQLASGTVSFGLHNPSASSLVTRLLSREAGSGAAQLVITGN